jgi:addiction module HigA family antidote
MASVPPLPHPGKVLREEFLAPLGMSAIALAKRLGVPRTRIERLVREETAVTVDTALRLARFFRTSPQLWLSLQAAYDLKIEAQAMTGELAAIVPWSHPAPPEQPIARVSYPALSRIWIR